MLSNKPLLLAIGAGLLVILIAGTLLFEGDEKAPETTQIVTLPIPEPAPEWLRSRQNPSQNRNLNRSQNQRLSRLSQRLSYRC